MIKNEAALFSRDRLGNYLARAARKVDDELLNYDPDELLLAAESDVIDYLVGLGMVEELVLHRERTYMLEPVEITKPSFRPNWPEQRVTRWTRVIPFSGDRHLFELKASSFTLNPPRAALDEHELHLRWEADRGQPTAAQLNTAFDHELSSIETHIGFTNLDVARHNRAMLDGIPGEVAARRAKHLADKQLQGELGYPIHRRNDAPAYAVPLNRRRIASAPRPTRPAAATAQFAPEPALADADYEAAIKVLLNARNALEHSPSMTAKLNEEHIRDLLLMNLNAHFEGKAAGEVFNGAGKTDILIRERDRNIFIGECKIFRGPKTVTDAISQLLTYLVWRDTKAALLLFIKKDDITSITGKAVSRIETHPNFKRRGARADEDRHDFVLHANGDPSREIRLALLPFLVGDQQV